MSVTCSTGSAGIGTPLSSLRPLQLSCLYCMPLSGLEWLPKSDILSYEEIAAVVGELAPLGLRRLRITGGEPTLRPDLERLIEMLRSIPEIEDISLSTNGVRLPALARLFADAGLDRVNMSADSLRPDRIRAISRRNTDSIQPPHGCRGCGLSQSRQRGS